MPDRDDAMTGESGLADRQAARTAAWPTAWWVLLLLAVASHGQGLKLESPRIEGFHPLDQKVAGTNPLQADHPTILELNTDLFHTEQDIDFAKRQVTFSKVDSLGFTVWQYHYPELSDYLRTRQRYSFFKGWHEDVATAHEGGPEERSLASLEFALPVQYPSWAQRVLGKEPPKLTIDGHLTITISYENARRDQETRTGEVKGGGFQFQQENSFTIRGTVGRLIDINISASSEEGFDVENPLKNFKIQYQGEGDELEDEIIQEVVAGYTGFAMPSTYLSGYSESHEGLFGIKIKSKIGPLTLTTIASHEQGEAQKLSKSRTATGGETALREYEFERFKFFFVDSLYLVEYLKRVAGRTDTVPLPRINRQKFQLWIKIGKAQRSERDVSQDLRQARYRDSVTGWFQRLEQERDYELNEREGWVMLTDSVRLTKTDVLGLVMETEDSTIVKGDTTSLDDTLNTMTYLWELKGENPYPDHDAFSLEWRNVYRMPRNPSEDFKIRVEHTPAGEDTSEEILEGPSAGKRLSDVMGLTEDGKPDLGNDQIYDTEHGVLIIPPFPDAQIGNQPFRNPAIGDTVPWIYTQSSNYFRDSSSRYTIVMTGATESQQTHFDLGWGVMEGTEVVKADGVRLQRDRDYVIDYQMGSLDLISKTAKAARNIDINYQREALFVPEKKVFLGARGEVALPFIGRNSFIGTSILFQNASTRDKIPRIGHEPFSKLLLDFNTKLDFEPEWITELVNKVPLINTEATSKVDVEFEVAHSRMNPNTDGKAFIDDFEASKQIYPLGESSLTWRRASPPSDLLDSLVYYPPAWNWYWFNPVDDDKKHRVERTEIWNVDRENTVITGRDRYERILRFVVQPSPDGSLRDHYVKPWAGVMTSIPASFANREDDKYLEFWARNTQGVGKLYIDMGVVSENIAINGGPPDTLGNHSENTEDTTGSYEYDENLDLGLDGLADDQEYYMVPDTSKGAFSFLDTTVYPFSKTDPNRRLNHKDLGRDNWRRYDNDNLDNYRFNNGLQDDRTLSSEDINFDETLEREWRERAFRVVIDFEQLAQWRYDPAQRDPAFGDTTFFLDTTANANTSGDDPDKHWHRYRIPLSDSRFLDTLMSGSQPPRWREIKFVRLWWTDFPKDSVSKEYALELTQMQFVGNQWQAVTAAATDTADTAGTVDTTLTAAEPEIEASVVNTDDDLEYRNMFELEPVPFKRESDVGGRKRREQSLSLTYRDLRAGEEALVERLFTHQTLDLSMYSRLRMFVRGVADYRSDSVKFVLRFGIDRQSYYEYRTGYIRGGWNANTVVADLKELSDLKLAYLDTYGDVQQGIDTSMLIYPAGANTAVDTADLPRYRVYAAEDKPPPTFSNIDWIGLGVVRASSDLSAPGVKGEIWVNELRAEDIRDLNGWGARLGFSARLADLLDFSAGADYRDGDFRQMTESSISAGNSEVKGNMRADLHLDKFLPSEWGVGLPLSGTISGSITRPQLKPNTDIYLVDEDGQSDRLDDMFTDGLSMLTGRELGKQEVTPSEHYETKQVSKSLATGYSKTAGSDNPLVNLTADRIEVDYNYSESDRSEALGRKPGSDSDYVDLDTSKTHRGKLDYDLTPHDPPKWTTWEPFADVDKKWFPSRYKSYRLNLLPSSIRLNLGDATYQTDYRYRSKVDTSYKTYDLDLKHGFSLRYEPISPLLSFDFSWSVFRELDSAVENKSSGWVDFVQDNVLKLHQDSEWGTYWLINGEESRNQNASVSLSPQFVGWLTHSADYKVDYSARRATVPDDDRDFLDINIGNTLTFNSTFEITDFFRTLSDQTGGVKPVGNAFSALETGFDKVGFRSVRFSYTATSRLNNRKVGTDLLTSSDMSSSDFFFYQLGGKGRSFTDVVSGDMDDEDAFGGMYYRFDHDPESRYRDDTREVTRDYSINTSLSFPDPLDISLSSLRLSWDESFTVTPDTSRWDTVSTRPEIGVSATWGILGKIGIIDKYMQHVSTSSSYTFKRTIANRDGWAVREKTRSHAFQPLARITGTVRKYPVRVSYEHSLLRDIKRGNTDTWSKTVENSDRLDLSYEVQRSTKIPEIKILNWTIPIRGKLEVGAAFEHSGLKKHEKVATRQDLQDDDQANVKSRTLSMSPHLSYELTDNITGKAVYTGKRQRENDISTMTHLFQLIVKILF